MKLSNQFLSATQHLAESSYWKNKNRNRKEWREGFVSLPHEWAFDRVQGWFHPPDAKLNTKIINAVAIQI